MTTTRSQSHIFFITMVIVLSGFCLFFLGMSAQTLLYSYRDVVLAKSIKISPATRLIIYYLAHRDEGTLIQVTLWLWWPILLTGVYSLMRYSKCPEKGIRCFMMGTMICWLLIAFLLLMCLTFCIPLIVCPISDLSEPPFLTRTITVISYCLPVIALLLSLFWWFTFRKKSSNKQE